MARPQKEGVDYFPLDVGFLRDPKIRRIKSEFGAKGIVILLYIWASAYEEHGYYFDTSEDDDFFLVSEGAGCGCTPELTKEVVHRSVERSLFNERVFAQFGVLTSQSMQRRFVRAVSKRENIYVKEEYWLLDIDNKKDIPSSISIKITFEEVNSGNNLVSGGRNAVNSGRNPQSRVKESKVKKSKVNKPDAFAPAEPTAAVFQTFEECGFKISSHAAERLIGMIDDYSEDWVIEAIKRSADRGKKTLSYIEGILRNWEQTGAIDGYRGQNGKHSSNDDKAHKSAEDEFLESLVY